MELKALTYLSILILCISSVSISIVAAPVKVSRSPSDDQLPPGYKLVLQSAEFKDLNGKPTRTWGKLGNKIGSGSYGTVYNVEGAWSGGDYSRAVVAKFMSSAEGVERNNLRDADELVDSGFNIVNKNQWVIIKKQRGSVLNELQSFYDAINSRSKAECERYFKKVRKAIVDGSRGPSLPGGPIHGFV